MATKDTTSFRDRLRVPDLVYELLHNRKAVVGLSILVPIIVVSALGQTITPYDPLANHILDRYQGPSGQYLLGTDHLGRDLLSRVIVGGRTSLLLGFGATALSLSLGVPIGLVAGYSKGRVDEVLMRVMDIVMSVPTLLLGLLILVALPSNVLNVIIAIGLVFTPRIARVTRSATLVESEEPYVLAAQARNESDVHILFREILPNVTAPIVVEGSIRVGYAIMIATSLSFLGLGSGPPYPDWGFMIATARQHIYETPWYLIWPSLALMLTIMATNLLGDGLRDVLDPKTANKSR
ncbi:MULTISPECIES: ABC transporter permease [Halorussus]|uniref:ABC transporter permease n=1 Tax=Halorussus TaxID=1070314 RepID=UPI0020A16401|nr:ABC transporter permease [Halorussus vallis]USZ77402.1 ABC transporter permease [Halorussus vallis]